MFRGVWESGWCTLKCVFLGFGGGCPKCAKMTILGGGQRETLKSGVFWGFGGGSFWLTECPKSPKWPFWGGHGGSPKVH